MDAKAIFELYGPLWEAIPETRPQCDFHFLPAGTPFIDPLGRVFLTSRNEPTDVMEFSCFSRYDDGTVEGMLEDHEVHALCRMAVIEWLMKHGEVRMNDAHLHAGMAHSPVVAVVMRDGSESPMAVAPTLDRALVAAALAVAGVGK